MRKVDGDVAQSGAASQKSRDGALGDLDPLDVDPSVDWNAVGGLDAHVHALKEMVVLPLMYPEIFERFHVKPPSGVLFYGPPGCGT